MGNKCLGKLYYEYNSRSDILCEVTNKVVCYFHMPQQDINEIGPDI